MNLFGGKMCNCRRFILGIVLSFTVSCLCSLLYVNAETPAVQNNGFVVEDNRQYQNIGSQVKLKANDTSNPEGTNYRFVVYSHKDGTTDIILDSQSTEAIWEPKEDGAYDLFMDVYVPGDNSSKVTHMLRVYAMEDRTGINNQLFPSDPIDSAFTPDIPVIEPEKAEETVAVSRYIGIRNGGGTCSLDSALQLLYHDQRFKGLILGLEGLNEEQTPYLNALKEQFIQMDSTTGTNVALTFTREQQKFLIAGDGEFLFDLDGVVWAETRLLNKCIEECRNSGRDTVVDSIKGMLCFDTNDVTIIGVPAPEEKQFSAMLVADKRDVLGLSIQSKIETCTYLPETINLVCMNENTGYYGFNDVIENASRIVLDDGRVFELQGVVMHPGGHYYSLVKNSESGDWVRLDDTNVIPVTGDVRTGGQAVQLTYREVK